MLMTNDDFELIGVRILPGCERNVCKVLHPGWYLFTERYRVQDDRVVENESYQLPRDFFSDNGKITVSAIVGKNGSGKSTVIEVMLAIINNLCFKIGAQRIYSDLYDAQGLCAELHYAAKGAGNDDKQWDMYCVSATADTVILTKNGESFPVKQYTSNRPSQSSKEPQLSAADIRAHLEELFCSIMINYSLHAYNIEGEKDDNWWMQWLVHKNDGYGIPVTINPYRWEGKLDMLRDTRLTNRRLGALWHYFERQNDIQFLEGYKLHSLHFEWRKEHIEKQYIAFQGDKPYLFSVRPTSNRFFDCILKEFLEQNDLRADRKMFDEFTYAYRYIVYKIVNISRTYPSYKKVKIRTDKSIIKFLQQDVSSVYDGPIKAKVAIKQLVTRINRDKTHITLKLRQTVNYLRYIESCYQTAKVIEHGLDEGYITEVLTMMSKSSNLTLSDIEEAYPPPFFATHIDIVPDNGRDQSPRSFTRLSSGERQLLFYVSTVLYHLQNLDSIQGYSSRRVLHRRVLVILEEIELYFHPEWQRQVVDKLIRHINICKFEHIKRIHLLLVSHSPFVLSDIPKPNVMFVDQGLHITEGDKRCEQLEAFGANIHEMLSHSFFLNRLMGDFAVHKINEWITRLGNDDDKIDDVATLRYELGLIGEPLIREQLLWQLDQKNKDKDEIRRQIEQLQQKLSQM